MSRAPSVHEASTTTASFLMIVKASAHDKPQLVGQCRSLVSPEGDSSFKGHIDSAAFVGFVAPDVADVVVTLPILVSPCVFARQIYKNRSPRQGRFVSQTPSLPFQSCFHPPLPRQTLQPPTQHNHGQPSVRRPGSTSPNHASDCGDFDPRPCL